MEYKNFSLFVDLYNRIFKKTQSVLDEPGQLETNLSELLVEIIRVNSLYGAFFKSVFNDNVFSRVDWYSCMLASSDITLEDVKKCLTNIKPIQTEANIADIFYDFSNQDSLFMEENKEFGEDSKDEPVLNFDSLRNNKKYLAVLFEDLILLPEIQDCLTTLPYKFKEIPGSNLISLNYAVNTDIDTNNKKDILQLNQISANRIEEVLKNKKFTLDMYFAFFQSHILGKDYNDAVNCGKEIFGDIQKKLFDFSQKSIGKLESQEIVNKSAIYKDLRGTISKSIVGQDEASKRIEGRLTSVLAGFYSTRRPKASFLLTGPTGVGKSETAKIVAKNLFDGRIFQVDLSTYQDSVNVNSLFGAPPGYIGYNDDLPFIKFIKENKDLGGVIVFEEADKCHPTILNSLLNMLTEGFAMSSKNEKLDMRSFVIFATTNLGAEPQYKKSLGFTSNIQQISQGEAIRNITQVDGFKKEIVGRFDEVINFNFLEKEDCKKIIQSFLNGNCENFKTNNNDCVTLQYSNSLIDVILENVDYRLLGARAFESNIEKYFTRPVSLYIVNNLKRFNQNKGVINLYIDENGVSEKKTRKRKANQLAKNIDELENDNDENTLSLNK